MKITNWSNISLIGALVAGISASLCCVTPLILVMFGVGGAWISTFTHLGLLRPVGIIAAGMFLLLAFWQLYVTPSRCPVDKACVKPDSLRLNRIVFWIVTAIILGLIAFPWYAPLLYW